ncbi:MAG TPA: adenylate/guanylate cyclase domain-containing protein [Mycobacteriales bacterium]|nr:adenylate/guanylate cyclase domain-containing protein [Mycobacteriales bacterium]
MTGDAPLDVTDDHKTAWQRMALRRLRRKAGRAQSEPLRSEDWEALWQVTHDSGRFIKRMWLSMPASPRCGLCSAPFAGFGRYVARPLGYRPSRKNPNFCASCVEMSPPGGTTMPVGVLFADIRGFTSAAEAASPEELSKLLRRFYGAAEAALFPEAIIDKLIGDEVMALYLPALLPGRDVPQLMLEHARRLLTSIGYGSAEGNFVNVGVGLDFGEAFVGNIGDSAVYDFTAVGDVVNTAARLQGQAKSGQIMASTRVVTDEATGKRVSLKLKGKREPEVAYRISV